MKCSLNVIMKFVVISSRYQLKIRKLLTSKMYTTSSGITPFAGFLLIWAAKMITLLLTFD